MLKEHYKDREKVEKLIALGDISSLGEEVDIPNGVEHSFEKPHEVSQLPIIEIEVKVVVKVILLH